MSKRSSKQGLPWVWNATPDEVARQYECDAGMRDSDDRLLRAISIDAAPDTAFAWLGNLRVAPYSYDWLDNFCRRSPRELRLDLGPLTPGQRIMYIFEAVSVELGRSFTTGIRPALARRLFGEVRITYAVEPEATGGSRLIGVLRFPATGGLIGAMFRWLLAWADLVMMRKQLMTLRDLAEQAERE